MNTHQQIAVMEKAAQRIMTKAQRTASEERSAAARAEREERERAAQITVLKDPVPVVLRSLSDRLTKLDGDLVEWRLKFQDDPLYALEWAQDQLFEVAAEREILMGFVEWLKSESADSSSPGVIAQEIERRARRMSPLSSRSTSPTSNLAEEAKRRVYCRWAWGDWDGLRIADLDSMIYTSLAKLAAAIELHRRGEVEEALNLL